MRNKIGELISILIMIKIEIVVFKICGNLKKFCK